MNTRSKPARGHKTVLLTLIALVCLVAGGTLVIQGVTASPSSGAPMPEREFDLDADQVPDPVIDTAASPPRPQTVDHSTADNSLSIPAIGAQADLVPLGLADDESLRLPTAVDAVTLWTGSAPLDAADGSILIAGHVDDSAQGAGALFHMHTVQPGDAIYVTGNGTSTRWKVISLQAVVKEALPDRVFDGPGGQRKLHVVTCGGPIVTDADGRATYRENVIVTAVPF